MTPRERNEFRFVLSEEEQKFLTRIDKNVKQNGRIRAKKSGMQKS